MSCFYIILLAVLWTTSYLTEGKLQCKRIGSLKNVPLLSLLFYSVQAAGKRKVGERKLLGKFFWVKHCLFIVYCVFFKCQITSWNRDVSYIVAPKLLVVFCRENHITYQSFLLFFLFEVSLQRMSLESVFRNRMN